MSNMNMKYGNVITECILDMWSGWFTAPDLKSISVRVSPCIRLPTTKETKTVIHWVLELSSGQQGCGHRGRANTFLLLVLVLVTGLGKQVLSLAQHLLFLYTHEAGKPWQTHPLPLLTQRREHLQNNMLNFKCFISPIHG